jgi:hypothetical protein
MMNERLQKSIEQYRKILDHAQQLDQLLSRGNPEQLRKYTAELQALQDVAAAQDRELLDELAADCGQWQAHPLFAERMRLLQQIVEMNDLLLPRISGMMSLAAVELTQLRDGRVAVAGYYPTGSRRGQPVRSVG